MKIWNHATLSLLLTLVVGVASVWGMTKGDSMKYNEAFPAAQKGMKKIVLQLPKKSNESLFKVQLLPGKIALTDSVNTFFFPGKIEKKALQGWGFYYYVVSGLQDMAGTLMAAPDDIQQKRFVGLAGEDYLIEYNSQVPVVVYLPQDAELRYRIWETKDIFQEAK